MASLSARGAAWLRTLSCEDLPADVVESTRLRILDVIGLALAANATDFGRAIRTSARSIGPGRESRVLGSGDRVTMSCAALANATLARTLDYDDVHCDTSLHVSSPNVATGLAIGEARETSGRDLIATLAGANELACRIAVAAQPFERLGFDPAGATGPLAAAFAAGRLLGLDEERMTYAVGLTGGHTAGVITCGDRATHAEPLHAGWASHAGIAAAVLARNGLSASTHVFEERCAWLATRVRDETGRSYSAILEDLGETWVSRAISFKSYPATHLLQGFIEALLHLRREHGLRASEVAEIICPIAAEKVPIMCEPIAAKIAPATSAHGRASLQYSLSEALVRGSLNVEAYMQAPPQEPEVLELARRIRYVIDPVASPHEPYRGSVIVHTRDGRTLEHSEPHPRGSPQRPMSAAELIEKFRLNAARTLPAPQIARILDMVMTLESLADTTWLVDECVGGVR